MVEVQYCFVGNKINFYTVDSVDKLGVGKSCGGRSEVLKLMIVDHSYWRSEISVDLELDRRNLFWLWVLGGEAGSVTAPA